MTCLGLDPFWVALFVGLVTFPINGILRWEGSLPKAANNVVIATTVGGLTIFGWALTSQPWNWTLLATMFLVAYGLNRLLDTTISLLTERKH